MGSKRTSRRDLLRSGAALAGGLTLGVPVHAQAHDHAMAPASGSENAYPMIPGNKAMIAWSSSRSLLETLTVSPWMLA